MSNEQSRRPIRVVDRRWFTTEGELRKPIPESEPAVEPDDKTLRAETPPESSSAALPSAAPEEEEVGGEVLLPSGVGFLDLVDALLRPAYALLSGQIPGGQPDPDGARYYIDLLEVLQTKTRGRLSPQETKVLDDALSQMRSLYLAAAR